ncbi:MAG: glycosyltransferase [Planctomycetota bacterium]|jgi:glycosyltransferase involved in cell wall biosynthesis
MIHYITTNGVGNAWVGNELRVVQREGVPVVLHAMRSPGTTFFTSEWARKLDEETRVIYPVSLLGLAVSVIAAPVLFRGRFFAALANALFGKRESRRARIAALWHFLVACRWARGLRREQVSHIHSQWIHSCGTIGMYGAWLLRASFSFTGHATDLFRDRVALVDKVRRADFIVCISTFHREFFLSLGAREDQCHIAYCGIDVDHFSPPSEPANRETPRILSAGRLVEKKGFPYLIDACRILADRGVALECVIAGSGPLEDELRAHVDRVGLSDRVSLTGEALKQELIPEFMHRGDVFCLPSVWSSDNDVEGLPQLLMEAMACGLPAVSTRIVGIPDLVIDAETGLLVPPRDAPALADALERLVCDPARAAELAAAGRQRVLDVFDLQNTLDPLVALFRARLGRRSDEGPGSVRDPGETDRLVKAGSGENP